jgi:uncharacterized damage-inducible protein DinB
VSETTSFPRTDPPAAADEATMLRSFLDYYRATILRQADGLTDEQRAATLGPSTLTLGGIVKHLTHVENWWFRMVLNDLPELEWVGDGFAQDPDWEFNSAKDDPWDLLVSRYQDVVAECDAILDAALATPEGLDLPAQRARHGKRSTLRWILVHLVEEYARHAGHADLIRESIDGKTDL